MRERLKRHLTGGSGRDRTFLGKTFFLHCQRRHPKLTKIPTYLPVFVGVLWCGSAALLRGVVCRGVVLCRVVSCGALLPCGAVLLGCAACSPLL